MITLIFNKKLDYDIADKVIFNKKIKLPIKKSINCILYIVIEDGMLSKFDGPIGKQSNQYPA
jgi:hypothetical protein